MSLTVCNIMSLDGFYAGSDGNPLVLPMDAAFDAYNLERLRAADSLLLGANSYRVFMGFWPVQATNPAASVVHREFGRIYRRIPVTVVSDSLTSDDVTPETTIVRRVDAGTHVKELSGNVITFGSRITWNALLAAGLVAEVHLIVGATGLGEGVPIFTGPVDGLVLAETRQLDGSDNVLLRYRRS